MFESPISNNKEMKTLPPLSPWTPLGLAKKYFFLISLIYMEILVLEFERPISNYKENKMFPPTPLGKPLANKY